MSPSANGPSNWAAARLPGAPLIATKEPAFGLDALWIAEADKERAQFAGYTVVDPPTVITTHLTEVIKSHQFAEDVAEQIQTRYGAAPGIEEIAAAFETRKEHRVVRIMVATLNSRHTKRIGEAAAEVLQTLGWQYVSPEDRPQVEVQVIDPPQEPAAPTLLFRLLTVVLHVSVALAVGVALAFLRDTFDDRVRTADEVERDLGWPVLAAVPHGKPGDPAGNRAAADHAADDGEQTTQ